MIAVGNGEACPYCKGKDKFINNPDEPFVEHLFKEHPKEAEMALFGGKDVGI